MREVGVTIWVEAMAAAFVRQAGFCERFGAPLWADLCRRGARDVAADGPIAVLLRDHGIDPAATSLPLRVLAGVHALALDGTAPMWAAVLDAAVTAAGAADRETLWRAWRAVLADQLPRVRPWLDSPPQTNEVGRCASLLGGFLEVARAGLPLRVLEVGASAGLNLRWDRYRIVGDGWAHGPEDARVVLRPRWRGAPPPGARVVVAERAGCDLRPIDVRDARERLRLCAYVWPERVDRARTLRAALDEAVRMPPVVERADAVAFLEAQLATPRAGTATVVFHSAVQGHMPADVARRFVAVIEAAGARATADAPLHWLSCEDEAVAPPGEPICHEPRLRSWPGDRELRLARAQPHGDWVDWQPR